MSVNRGCVLGRAGGQKKAHTGNVRKRELGDGHRTGAHYFGQLHFGKTGGHDDKKKNNAETPGATQRVQNTTQLGRGNEHKYDKRPHDERVEEMQNGATRRQTNR